MESNDADHDVENASGPKVRDIADWICTSFGELWKEVVSDPGPRTPEGTGVACGVWRVAVCGGVPRGFKPYALRQ